MACSICFERGVELHVNETWSGSFHSACSHAACRPCISNWINECLPRCRTERHLRIQCFHPGCRKSMPQKLVLHASYAARLSADAIDKVTKSFPELKPCPQCGMSGVLLVNQNCSHSACEHCWFRWATEQLPSCQASSCTCTCLQNGCLAEVDPLFWQNRVWCDEVGKYFANFPCELKRLQKYGGCRFDKMRTEPGPCCPTCGEHCLALLINDCGCAACEGCWLQWTEKQSEHCHSQCAAEISCIRPGCPAGISAFILEDMCNLSQEVKSFVRCTDKELKRLQKHGGSRMNAQPTDPGPLCPVCGEICFALLVNDCGCAACEGCWLQWSKKQSEHCRFECATDISCIHPVCPAGISVLILEDMCILSQEVKSFLRCTDKELKRLQKHGGSRMNAQPTDPGPWCQVCGEIRLALLVNDCGCAACEGCWLQWSIQQVVRCRAECAIAVPCMRARSSPGLGCCTCSRCQSSHVAHPGAQISSLIWTDMCALSQEVKAFDKLVNTERERLQKFALTTRSGAAPIDPAVCFVCHEQKLFLLQGNDSCNHAACEECWARWVEVQIEECLFHRRVQVRCIGAECTSAAAAGIWSHTCTRSGQVAHVDGLLSRRRRLQQNSLFPAEMQVNCPQLRCVGLGYLGFDTVMCFICEHQWHPDHEGEPPADVDVEVVMGVKVKRCPKCGKYIEKNGGCDHMTCRHRGCGYEFWWSTLKPYRP